jgi:protein-disulfide isomerase
MRKLTILVAGVALTLATAASAQQQPAEPPAAPAPAAPNAPSAAPTINTVSIVDIKDLPEATQAQVNDVVAKRSDADLQKLRSSIDATPEIKSALEAKGLSSAQVIAASMGNNGALTLITKKAS